MHELLTKVLSDRDLSRAGDLFSVPDADIVNDITEVLCDINPIISHPDYLKNNNDQSVVEICVTRVLSCIRESKTAENYCSVLVNLLKTCLLYNLQPVGNYKEDPPHAKIAADIISSIFLNHDKRELMRIALPVAVQFLQKGNKELSRNLASYLSLAAIKYAYLLSPHVEPIINSIKAGNYGLLRVLAQIYEVSPDEVTPHATQLIGLLHVCDTQEKVAIVQLYLVIAQKSPQVLEKYVPQLCEFLEDPETSMITMQILLKFGENYPQQLVQHLEKIANATKNQLNLLTIGAQILTFAGKANKATAQYALDFILDHLPNADRSSQGILLQEATKLCSMYPVLFTDKVLSCVQQKNALSSQQKLATSEVDVDVVNKISGGVTIVNLNRAATTSLPETTTTNSTTVKPTIVSSVKSENNNQKTISPMPIITADPVTSTTTVSVSGVSTASGPTATFGRRPKNKSKSRSSPSSPKDPGRNNVASAISNINNNNIPNNQNNKNTHNKSNHNNNNNNNSMASGFSTITSSHTGYTRRVKLGDSRSTGRLHPTSNTHRSMTRLNVGGGSVGGLHKSMTRLSSSQYINQNGYNSNNTNSNTHTNNSTSTPISTTMSSGNVIVQANNTTVGGCTPKISSTFSSMGYVTPVPPLSNNVIITGHNKLGIPSTQVTSGGVTVTTSPIKVRPNSHGLTMQFNSNTALNQCMSSLITFQNAISVHHASPANQQPAQQKSNHKSVMKLPVNENAVDEVIVSGPTTNVTQLISQDNTSRTLLNANNSIIDILDQRMSTFEPYQIMRDPVQQFCEKHFNSIKSYMDEVSQFLPPPTRCSIEVSNELAERRTKKVAKLHFACQIRGPHCLYSKTCFTMRTRNPKTWIHLMFLDFQVRHYVKEKCVLSTREPGISHLKNIWQILKCENRTFTELVTSQFPNSKDREILVNELRHSGFLDVFEVSKTLETNQCCNELEYQWGCFLCNHPDKAVGFLNGSNQPMIEGQLKEKKGKWRLFRRWRTRYFTLSGAHLSCKGSSGGESIDVNQIRSVKVSRGARNIPKAFEIFTADQTLILKPKNGKNAEEWVQCLSIVVAHSQSRDNPIDKTNSLPARGNAVNKPIFT